MAEPLPQPGIVAPATAFDLGHPFRFVLRLTPHGVPEYRANCACHPWWLLEPVSAEAAWKRQGQR